MAMTGYTKLFSSIVTSTVWSEPDHVRLVWITLLAITNRHGVAEASLPGLAKLASVTLEQCEDAMHKLSGPDKYSRTKDFDGRRICEIDGGWRLINHEKYRAKMGADERREYNRVKQSERRERMSMTVNDISCASALSAHTEADTDTEAKKNNPSRRAARAEPGEPTDFETFWNLYPNRKGKQSALRAWRKLNPDADLVGVMSSALVWQVRQPQWTKDGGQYVPMLSTWLNGRRWEDEVTQIRTGVAQNGQHVGAWRDECDRLHRGQCGNAHFHAAKMDRK